MSEHSRDCVSHFQQPCDCQPAPSPPTEAAVPGREFPQRMWVAEKKENTNVFDAFNADSPRPCPTHHGCIYVQQAELLKQVRQARAEAIETINQVQLLIQRSGMLTNSSDLFAPIKEAFNINARYLSANFAEQSEYLAKAQQAREEGK